MCCVDTGKITKLSAQKKNCQKAIKHVVDGGRQLMDDHRSFKSLESGFAISIEL